LRLRCTCLPSTRSFLAPVGAKNERVYSTVLWLVHVAAAIRSNAAWTIDAGSRHFYVCVLVVYKGKTKGLGHLYLGVYSLEVEKFLEGKN